MIEPKKKYCKYCKEEIDLDASVCSTCGKYQNWFRENIAHSISFLVFLLAVIQLWFASIERSKAEDAYTEAKIAKDEIKTAQKTISKVSQAIVMVAKLLPKITGYGSGLNKRDKALLDSSIEILNKYKSDVDE